MCLIDCLRVMPDRATGVVLAVLGGAILIVNLLK